MTIAEFAEVHGVDAQTVRIYLKRHPEIRKHTHMDGRIIVLETEALEKLDKAYPLPKPVTVIKGIPHEEHERVLKELAAVSRRLAEAQTARIEDQQKLTEVQSRALMLEDRERRISDRISELEEEIRQLRNRSLWDRILNK